jgi:muconolactone D-isomerase
VDIVEFLVEFEMHVPQETPESQVTQRYSAEAAASAELAREGHLVRLWRPPARPGERKAIGLYRADSRAQLVALLDALPLSGWMQTTITPLEPHPNDPAGRDAAERAGAY